MSSSRCSLDASVLVKWSFTGLKCSSFLLLSNVLSSQKHYKADEVICAESVKLVCAGVHEVEVRNSVEEVIF